MANCAELPTELLVNILMKLLLLEDFASFAGVCTSWLSVATKQMFRQIYSPEVPVLMVSKVGETFNRKEFYNIFKQIVIGGNVLDLTGKWYVQSKGWLFTINRGSGEVQLVHPFTRHQIQLPRNHWVHRHLHTAVLSANPSEVAIFSALIISGKYFCFWKSGDRKWELIEITDYVRLGAFTDAIFYKGNYYAITWRGIIVKLDISGLNPTPVARVITRMPKLVPRRTSRVYLVDLLSDDDKLFVVARHPNVLVSNNVISAANDYAVFEVDLIREISYLVQGNLGDMAIFVSQGPSISVKASRFPGLVKPNCIYFSNDDFYNPHFLGVETTEDISCDNRLLRAGVYDMKEASFKPHFQEGGSAGDPNAIWVTPTFE